MDVTGKSFHEVIKEVKDNDLVVEYKEPEKIQEVKLKTLPDDCVNLSDKTQIEFFNESKTIKECICLIRQRMLDKGINSPKTFYISLIDKTHKNRLVIPFYNTEGDIVYYQSRTVLASDNFTKPKYLSKTGGEKSLYGISNVDDSLPYIFILEGPIDSFFVKNGVAVCGIQDESERMFTELQKQQFSMYPTHEKIWVLDNQWCDTASLKKSRILIEQGQAVFIWPEELKRYKDINEYVVKYGLSEFKTQKILDNTYRGLKGIMMLDSIKNS